MENLTVTGPDGRPQLFVGPKQEGGIRLSRSFLLGAALAVFLAVIGPALGVIYFAGQTIQRLDTLTHSVQGIESDIRGKITDELREGRDHRIRMIAEQERQSEAIRSLQKEIEELKRAKK